ncbi:HIT family protein [Candidatus Gracilibacteria bacterium]|nr:HIT family protein [Candidatus Gracilibacteria bacterium]
MSCIFCDIVSGKAPSWIVYQDEYVTAFFDYFPASKGHVLIVPNAHYENLTMTPDEILSKIIVLSKRIALFYEQELSIDHLNIVQRNGKYADQEVMHYHMHVIPREKDDNIYLNWTPDEGLRDSYDELKQFISNGL